jgi:hypothetical protein
MRGYREVVDCLPDVELDVQYLNVGRDVVDYSVVLLLTVGDQVETVRVYGGSHGVNELHRYTKSDGKQVAEVFHRGTLGEGMRAAVDHIKTRYMSIIEGWEER